MFSDKVSPPVWGVMIPSATIAMIKFDRENPKASLKKRTEMRKKLKDEAHERYAIRKAAGLKESYFKTKPEAEAYAKIVQEKCGFEPEVAEVSFL